MKKILMLVTVFCFIAFPALNAQTDKGTMLFGVSSTVDLSSWGSDHLGLGFSSTKYVNSAGTSSPAYKTNFLNLIPKVGYFVIDNLAAGLDLTLSTYSTKYNDKSKMNGTLLCVGPFARYYVALLDRFKPFGEVNIGIGTKNSKNKSSTGSTQSEHKSGVFLFGLWAGMAMPLGDMVTFDAMLGYNHVTYKTKVDSSPVKSLNLQSESTKEKVGTFGVKMGFVIFFDM